MRLQQQGFETPRLKNPPNHCFSQTYLAMNFLPFPRQVFVSLLILSISSASETEFKIKVPRLNPTGGVTHEDIHTWPASLPAADFKTFFYTQTLDHFNYRPESYTTFQQRYVVNSKYWGGGSNIGAPILAYLGAEAPLDDDLNVIGFLSDNAVHFNALLVYIEVIYTYSIGFLLKKKKKLFFYFESRKI